MILKLCKPTEDELNYRSSLLKDEATMSYNAKWGGTVDFPRENWNSWYSKWVLADEKERFYRYLYSPQEQCYVGEVCYRCEGDYIASIIVEAKHRGKGYGTLGLRLLMDEARKNGIAKLCDDIALDNPSIRLFLREGFREIRRNEDCVIVEKLL